MGEGYLQNVGGLPEGTQKDHVMGNRSTHALCPGVYLLLSSCGRDPLAILVIKHPVQEIFMEPHSVSPLF